MKQTEVKKSIQREKLTLQEEKRTGEKAKIEASKEERPEKIEGNKKKCYRME